MKHKILILSASAGSGHVRCGQAMEKAFAGNPEVIAVKHCDALDFTNKLFRDFYSKLYAQLVEKAPDFLGWWYKQTDEPWKTDKARLMLDRLNTRPLVNFIRDFNPDICLCTHFMPAGIISHLIGKGALQTNLSIIITDYDFHAMWLARHFHRYFVARDEVQAHLAALGIPTERISVTGIPIDPAFAAKPPSKPLRREENIPQDIPVALLNVSGIQEEDISMMIHAVAQADTPVHAIVLCGKNPDTRDWIQSLAGQTPQPKRFTLLGYTSDMHKWMGLSDLYIGKPGGLASAEALAMGLPMMIVSPIPGQEERNSDFLLENGAAIKCASTVIFRFRLEKLLNSPELLDRMKKRASALGSPHAAAHVAGILLNDGNNPHHPRVSLTPPPQ
ncbi:glycosyltransferase [Oscillatoria amoena NRMC-F 0135]|nr:glycosyltransferase [Oscillatoria amoena NRMC-F 0135]